MWRSVAVGLLVACSSGLSVGDKGTTPPTDGPPDTGPRTTEPGHTAVVARHTAVPEENLGPTADAGEDLSGLVTDWFDLDGSGSSDPNGDPLTYEWTFLSQPVGSGANLLDADTAHPAFVGDRAGAFVLELAVDDGEFSSTDTVTVTVAAPNAGPVANAGVDVTVDVGDLVVLDGTLSYDPEGDPITYDWALVTTPGASSTFLSDARTALPNFRPDVDGLYEAELIVSDGLEFSLPDRVTVLVRAPSSGDCNSCETVGTPLQRRFDPGQAAGALLLLGLPLAGARWNRRRAG